MRLIRALQDDAIRRRAEKRFDAESMAVTGRLLEINPEVFTAWNFRRDAIVGMAERAQMQHAQPAAAAAAAEMERSLPRDGEAVAVVVRRGGAGDDDATVEETAAAATTATTTPGVTDSGVGRPQTPPPALASPAFAPSLRDELALTQRTLGKHPKSYPSWHHRKWAVQRMVEAARAAAAAAAFASSGSGSNHVESNDEHVIVGDDKDDADTILTREMKLCVKLLELDDRNFHCWGYRRFLVALRGAPDAEELDYTTQKIETNFSNYSAWHHRTTYLPRVHGVHTPQTARTDPDPAPSAASFSKTTQPTRPPAGAPDTPTPTLPKDVLDAEYELVQQAFFTEPEDQSGWMYHRWLLGNTLGGRRGSECGDGSGSGSGSGGRIQTRGQVGDDHLEKEQLSVQGMGGLPDGQAAGASGGGGVQQLASGGVEETLARESDLCRQLMEMEPDSKWPVVTLARLCQAAGSAAGARESVGSFRRLAALDPMRAGYYCDCCRQ